jgi:hypothetical protein
MECQVTALCHENEANGNPRTQAEQRTRDSELRAHPRCLFEAYVLDHLAATSPPRIQVL